MSTKKIMLIDTIPRELKEALAYRLDAAELVDFLRVPTEEIIELLEDTILANLDEVLELAGLTNNEEDLEDYAN